jgi:hypothetical protein
VSESDFPIDPPADAAEDAEAEAVPSNGPPAEITHLVRQRAEARTRRDWPRADALKAQIEAAGWKVVDRGPKTTVARAGALDVEIDGVRRYGSAATVPSLLDAEPAAGWSVVVLASETPDRVSRLLAGLRAHAPDGIRVVIVANDPSRAQEKALVPGAPDLAPIAGFEPELLRTAARVGVAAALNIAMRRAAGEHVLLTDGTAWPTGDALTPLAAALADPGIAVAGAFGLRAAEPGRLHPASLQQISASGTASGAAVAAGAASASGAAVTALESAWLAFRRADYVAFGPFDEQFVTPAWFDLWWSLRLRAGLEPAQDEPSTDAAPPIRRALLLRLPIERDEAPWPPDRSHLNRRNMYRVLDEFGARTELFDAGGTD